MLPCPRIYSKRFSFDPLDKGYPSVYSIRDGSVSYTKRFQPKGQKGCNVMGSNGWSATYRYTEADVRAHAPTAGGVYRLMYSQDGKLYVLYVGESGNLEERLLAHLSAAEPRVCVRRHLQTYTCYFDFVRVGPESERKRVEGDTIRQFNPSCNA